MTPVPKPFDVLVRFRPDEWVVCPRGEIDVATAPLLEAVYDAVAGSARRLILDLVDVEFMDAAGVNIISRLASQLDASGAEFVVRSPSRLTRRLLDLFGFGDLVESHRTQTRTSEQAEQRSAAANVPVLRSLDEVRAASSRARERTIDAALNLVVELAAVTVSSADNVSVTLRRGGQFTTVAASDETANGLDVDQYNTGQGPCVHAATTGQQTHVASTLDETRWPDFVPHALAAGVTTILSTPLTINAEPVGALNIYSHGNQAFGVDQQDLAQLIAGQAAAILGEDRDDLPAAERVRRLQDALETREVIAQAQGILMQRDRITAEDAADYLRRFSRQTDIPLRRLAADIIVAAAANTDPSTGG